MPTFDLDQSDTNELVQLVYSKWSEAYTNLKHAKAEDYDKLICPRAEWPQFHAIRIENAQKDFTHWQTLLDKVKPLAKYAL